MTKSTRSQIEGVRKIVRERDGNHCQRCGRSIVDYPASIHHRMPRGMGGSNQLDVPHNLITVCGTGTSPDDCHWAIESARHKAFGDGWLVWRGDDPLTVPIRTYHGLVYLTTEGEFLAASEEAS